MRGAQAAREALRDLIEAYDRIGAVHVFRNTGFSGIGIRVRDEGDRRKDAAVEQGGVHPRNIAGARETELRAGVARREIEYLDIGVSAGEGELWHHDPAQLEFPTA